MRQGVQHAEGRDIVSARALREALEARGLLAPGEPFSADLHVHSTVSDGSQNAPQIAREAHEAGLTHVALTNHDTTFGLREADRAARASDVRLVGGVEVSAYDFARGRKVHILGLGLREESHAVEALCADTLARREANSRWQLDRLIEAGYAPDIARIEALAAASTCLYKQHIMAGLTDEPYGSAGYASLYRSLFKGDGICARDIVYVDARDAVRAIAEDGGLAVLAHPGQLDSWDVAGELVSCGLGGIEERHPDHDAADERRAREVAEAYGLACTAGSDYHGRFGAPACIGVRRVEG